MLYEVITNQERFLRDPVGCVGRFRVPLPEIVFPERDAGRPERVGTDRPDLDELLCAGASRLLHEKGPHSDVVVEEASRVRQVPADPAGVGGQVDPEILPSYNFV